MSITKSNRYQAPQGSVQMRLFEIVSQALAESK